MSATPYDLLKDIKQQVREVETGTEYAARMLHKVPAAPVVDRANYIAKACRNLVVLSLGATGPMQTLIDDSAAKCYKVDTDIEWGPNRFKLDLTGDNLPREAVGDGDTQLIVAGEVLEHLHSPGRLLNRLREWYPEPMPMVITVPNAFCEVGRQHLVKNGRENVNLGHVAYYSYWTLKHLLDLCHWKIKQWAWYNGKPLVAEGLLFVVE